MFEMSWRCSCWWNC